MRAASAKGIVWFPLRKRLRQLNLPPDPFVAIRVARPAPLDVRALDCGALISPPPDLWY